MNKENYEEDWAIYFTRINEDQFCSILVDLGLHNIAPDESKPFLITITTFMNNPAEDGFSTESENETLNQIEENFIDLLGTNPDVIYAGRLKFGGKIQSYFYSEKEIVVKNIISEVKTHYPSYRFEYDIREEKDWKAYFEVLYPSPFEMQVIQNARVIENLEEHGDKLEKERAVDHWIYFSSETDRENFLDAIKDQGFEIIDKDITSLGDMPFELQLSRVDKVDYQSVNEYVLYLWEQAQKFNGEYDGWETFVVND